MEFISNNIVLIILAVIVIFFVTGIRIANENERFVVSALGKYVGIKGPGLLLKWPNSSFVWHRVALNDDGQYLGDGLVKVKEAVFPAEYTDSLKTGDSIKIVSFKNNCITISKSS